MMFRGISLFGGSQESMIFRGISGSLCRKKGLFLEMNKPHVYMGCGQRMRLCDRPRFEFPYIPPFGSFKHLPLVFHMSFPVGGGVV